MVFVDEPCLGMVDPAALTAEGSSLELALREVVQSIRSGGALAGLHCCAAFPFAVLNRVKPDIVSFDAHAGFEEFFADRDAAAFVSGGGAVAFGLIPAQPGPPASRGRAGGTSHPEAIAGRFRAAAESEAARAAGFPPLRYVMRRSLVTATCGLAFLDEPAARESFDQARAVSRLLRAG